MKKQMWILSGVLVAVVMVAMGVALGVVSVKLHDTNAARAKSEVKLQETERWLSINSERANQEGDTMMQLAEAIARGGIILTLVDGTKVQGRVIDEGWWTTFVSPQGRTIRAQGTGSSTIQIDPEKGTIEPVLK